jgi:hypothetical protein
MTQEPREAIGRLRKTACQVLKPLLRQEMQAEKLKSRFAGGLRQRLRSKAAVRRVMRYWPNRKSFKQVRGVHTLNQLETIRRWVDRWQAVRELEQRGQEATTENIRPLLHTDMTTHINDTHEQLPGIVVAHPTPEQMRRIILGSVSSTMSRKQAPQSPPRREAPLVTLDFRRPQVGLARRTAQRRFPQKGQVQRGIRAALDGVISTEPVLDETPHTSKTPIRGSAYSQVTQDGGND